MKKRSSKKDKYDPFFEPFVSRILVNGDLWPKMKWDLYLCLMGNPTHVMPRLKSKTDPSDVKEGPKSICIVVRAGDDDPEPVADQIKRQELENAKYEYETEQDLKPRRQDKLADVETLAMKRRLNTKSPVYENIDLISEVFDLSLIDKKILNFVIFLKSSNALAGVANMFRCDDDDVLKPFAEVVSLATNLKLDDVNEALSPKGRLYKSGVFVPNDHSSLAEDCVTTFLDDRLSLLFTKKLDKKAIFRALMTKSQPSKCSLSNFSRVKKVNSQLIPLLKAALRDNRKGCNVLVYGNLEDDKAEFVKAVVSSLNQKLLKVTYKKDTTPKNRLSRVVIANRILAGEHESMLLIDKCDDIFSAEMDMPSNIKDDKAYIDYVLKNNDRPSFWICNSIDSVSSDLLSKFDFIAEINPARRRTRTLN